MEQVDYQALRPVRAVDFATVYGAEGPLGSSIMQHQGRAHVEVIDQARAADLGGMFGQLGANAPGGLAPQPADHTAPSTVGAQFRQSPQRPAGAPAMPLNHEPREVQRPATVNLKPPLGSAW